MDVVVADITPKFGMLLSRYWEKKVGGTLQMDLSYATIPIFGGENKRLYRELQYAYIVTNDINLTNHPIYDVEKDLGYCMLHFSDEYTDGIYEWKMKIQSNVVLRRKMSYGRCILMAPHPRREKEQEFF